MLFFSEMNYRGNHAGTKARNDAEAILRQYGASPINSQRLELQVGKDMGIQSNIVNRLGFIRYFCDILFVRNKTVVIQYPMLAFDIQFDYVRKLAKHNRVVFLVHDIQSLRREGHVGLEQEIQMLNIAWGLIVHNRFMAAKLEQLGVRTKRVYLLNCFDYLYHEKELSDTSMDGVAFAGNLEKSVFLSKMCNENGNLPFHFFGPSWSADYANSVYYGNFSPDEIPGKLCGKYGLIWDGNTTQGCSGAVGEYTRINNPHKMSLYIAAGMPVIAWSDAAIAEFIQRNHIGIVLDRIDCLLDALAEISDAQYQEMKKNVFRIRERLVTGDYLRTVLKAIEEDDK